MRSGPATQTAFAMRESHRCLAALRTATVPALLDNACPATALSCGGASAPENAFASDHAVGCSPAMRDRF